MRANWLRAVADGEAPPSKVVICESASSSDTDTDVPMPLVVLLSALSNFPVEDRASPLASTRVLTPASLTRLVSTPLSARPSAGHAARSTAPSPVPLPVGPNVCRRIWPATVLPTW